MYICVNIVDAIVSVFTYVLACVVE
jgi:hypothetical protein